MWAMTLDWNSARRLNMAAALVIGVLALVVSTTPTRSGELLASQSTVTVRGCLEKDAASRVAIYKLAAATASGTVMYRLTASGAIDFEAELGRTVEVTGTLSARDPNRPREELSIAVQALKRTADRCS